MATRTRDYPTAAARIERKLKRLGLSKAETGRRLGLTGDYARVRVGKVLRGDEVSWKLLARIEEEVIAPEKAERAQAAPAKLAA